MHFENFFVKENDDISISLARQGFPVGEYFSQISVIGSKSRNNKVGIAQFGTDEKRYRVSVIPKTLENSEADYLEYLKKVCLISARHNRLGQSVIDDCFFDFSMKFPNGASALTSLDDFIDLNYLAIFDSIRSFFLSHSAVRNNYFRFESPGLEYELDLFENITRCDKSSISQIRRAKEQYSDLANIAVAVLKSFIKNKCGSTSNPHLIRMQALAVVSLITRRFQVSYKAVKVEEIATARVIKLFKGGRAEALLKSLRLLAGYNSQKGSDAGPYDSANDVCAIFFSPERIYQVHLFDLLRENLKNHTVMMEPVRNYLLHGPKGLEVKMLSKPDIVIENRKHPKKRYVIDVKWKLIEGVADFFYSDISKLNRDAQIHDAYRSALVYPCVSDGLTGTYRLSAGSKFTYLVFQIPF